LGHEGPADGQHLLLAAAQESRRCAFSISAGRENLKHVFHGLFGLGRVARYPPMRRFSSTLLSLKIRAFRTEHDPLLGARLGLSPMIGSPMVPNLSHDGDALAAGHFFFFADILHDAGKGVHQG
jgi:hypothetical protein